jgi:tRNA (guanine-N7-)-methyltransferase
MDAKYLNNNLLIDKKNSEVVLPEKFLNSKKFLEIGFGGGEYLIKKSLEDKNSFFIGLELSLLSTYKIQKICTKKEIKNIGLILIDARFALRNIFELEYFDGIYMNFPCPWPKKKHSVNRLNDRDFSVLLLRVLKTNGFFQLYSDSKEFVDNFIVSLSETKKFTSPVLEINPEIMANTKYEGKWLEQRKNIYKLSLYKNHDNGEHFATDGRYEMPHFKIENFESISKIQEILNKNQKIDNTIIVYKRILKDIENEVYKIETLAIDLIEGNKKFEQKINIVIRKREKDWIIKLDDFMNPYRTDAVKNAIFNLKNIIS